jgi:hypothetical protein
MWAPRASASTSSGWAYSRSIRSRTRRNRARSRRCCAVAGLLVTCEIVPRRAGVAQRRRRPTPLRPARRRTRSAARAPGQLPESLRPHRLPDRHGRPTDPPTAHRRTPLHPRRPRPTPPDRRRHTPSRPAHRGLTPAVPRREPDPRPRPRAGSARRRQRDRVLVRTVPNPYLFPGAQPGQPLAAGSLARRLKALGVKEIRLARNGALLAMVGSVHWNCSRTCSASPAPRPSDGTSRPEATGPATSPHDSSGTPPQLARVTHFSWSE